MISIHALLAESDGKILPACCIHLLYFYPRSPCGERPSRLSQPSRPPAFLSTLSLRRATGCQWGPGIPDFDFYPRSPCGERRGKYIPYPATWLFLSTLSLRRATPSTSGQRCFSPYFYPRSPCGERLGSRSSSMYWQKISIHALLAESDAKLYGCTVDELLFLSTLSLRRATTRSSNRLTEAGYFYPRSPCGERHDYIAFCKEIGKISIHALLAESDA